MRRLLCLIAILSLTACAPASSGPTNTPVSTNPSPISPQAQPAVDAARREAATRLGVTPDQVTVAQVEARDWSDASLGCPQPGQLYSQVITPGFLIVVAGGGKQLEYHADRLGRAVFCTER